MPEWMLTLIIGSGISIGVMIFARLCPKAKLVAWTVPKSEAVAVMLNKLLILRFGQRAADQLEEGVIATLCLVIIENVKAFMAKLLADNKDGGK